MDFLDSRHLAAPPVVAPAIARATVCAGVTATDYLRAGCGEPVLLLCGRPERPLLAPLAARFRVIAPDLPCDPTRAPDDRRGPFSEWLRDFLDGLGVARTHVVADEPYALRTLRFTLTDPTRVDRIALLFRDAHDPAISAGPRPELLGHSGHPLLVSCDTGVGVRGDACATVADEILRFLLGDGPRPDCQRSAATG